MNNSMDVPSFGMSPEELSDYTRLLLAVGEIAETLQSHEPDAKDDYYTVSDPRIIDSIVLPLDMQLISGMESLRDISFKVVAHKKVDKDNDEEENQISKKIEWLSNTSLILGFQNDDTEVVIQPTPSAALANKTHGPESTVTLSRRDLSNLIAQIAYPSQDPSLVDYTNITSAEKAFEVSAVLEANDMVTHTTERMYLFDNEFKVIIQRKEGKLLLCEIVSFQLSDPTPVTLSLGFKNFSNIAELYTEPDDGGSKELALQSGDIKKFTEIIEKLQLNIKPNEIPVDPYLLTQDEL